LDLCEARFPEPQHMLRHVELGRDLADGTERFGRFRGSRGRGRKCGRTHSSTISRFGASPLIMALSTWLGRNTSTRRGAMGTSVPVFGLRPMRWDFWRTANVPNEDSFTVSPRASASHTSS